MKYVVLLALLSGPVLANQHVTVDPPPGYRFVLLGAVYKLVCRSLDGVYVNDNPNFYQGWSCRGINWCEQRPETLGCGNRGEN